MATMTYITERLLVVQERLEAKGIQEEFSVAILVKTLSGEIVPIGIHMEEQITPHRFVQQMGYNPSIVQRTILLDAGDVIPQTTWKHRYGTPEEIPVIYVIIQDESDKDRQAKLKLIHTILRNLSLAPLPDDLIWSSYSSWNMTYLAHKTNRYIKLQDFVLAHPTLFVPFTQEEIQERTRKEEEEIQERARKAEEEKEHATIKTWIQFRDREIRYVRNRMNDPAYLENRQQAGAFLRNSLERDPNISLLGDRPGIAHTRQVLCQLFTIQELIDMGMKSENISTKWWIVKWNEMAEKAQIYEAEH